MAAGRKRKQGVKRTKSGAISRASSAQIIDRGTWEAQRKRHSWINGADPQLAASASGIMLANGQIDEEMHLACQRYARAHALIYRRPWHHVQNTMGVPVPWAGHEPTEADHEWAEKVLQKWHRQLTDEQRLTIANVAVFSHLPTWSYAHKLGWRVLPEDHAEREALLSGLDALVKVMGIREQRTRAIEGGGSWADTINAAAEQQERVAAKSGPD